MEKKSEYDIPNKWYIHLINYINLISAEMCIINDLINYKYYIYFCPRRSWFCGGVLPVLPNPYEPKEVQMTPFFP